MANVVVDRNPSKASSDFCPILKKSMRKLLEGEQPASFFLAYGELYRLNLESFPLSQEKEDFLSECSVFADFHFRAIPHMTWPEVTRAIQLLAWQMQVRQLQSKFCLILKKAMRGVPEGERLPTYHDCINDLRSIEDQGFPLSAYREDFILECMSYSGKLDIDYSAEMPHSKSPEGMINFLAVQIHKKHIDALKQGV